jgi:HTH-type transcriptional regulator/antitoxin HigA
MKLKVIKTEKEYEEALARVADLMDARKGTPEGDELELLSTLVHAYEEKVFPIDLPDPVEAIRFRMEQQGLKPRDVVPYFGSASKVSEVLSGRRSLSLTMIRNLTKGLRIPATVLVGEPESGHKSKWRHIGFKWSPSAGKAKRKWFHGNQRTLSQAKKRAKRRSSQPVA